MSTGFASFVNANVRVGSTNPLAQAQQNVTDTQARLERLRLRN